MIHLGHSQALVCFKMYEIMTLLQSIEMALNSVTLCKCLYCLKDCHCMELSRNANLWLLKLTFAKPSETNTTMRGGFLTCSVCRGWWSRPLAPAGADRYVDDTSGLPVPEVSCHPGEKQNTHAEMNTCTPIHKITGMTVPSKKSICRKDHKRECSLERTEFVVSEKLCVPL